MRLFQEIIGAWTKNLGMWEAGLLLIGSLALGRLGNHFSIGIRGAWESLGGLQVLHF